MSGFSNLRAAKVGNVNVNNKFSEITFSEQRMAEKPLIGGSRNRNISRILDGDILLGRFPQGGVDSTDDDGMVEQYTGVISVLNGIGDGKLQMDQVKKEFFFAGIANGSAGSQAMGGGTATTIAGTRQGRISTFNKWTEVIRAGDQLMVEFPENTDEAILIAATMDKTNKRNNTPKDRYTAFLKPVHKADLHDKIMKDVVHVLHHERGANTQAFSFSVPITNELRRLMALGALVGAGASQMVNGNTFSQNFNAGMNQVRAASRLAAVGGAPGAVINSQREAVEQILNGNADALLGALLDPGRPNGFIGALRGYPVVAREGAHTAHPGPGAVIPASGQAMISYINDRGAADFIDKLEYGLMEAGKRWIVATAETSARPGDTMTILLRS